MPNQKKKTKVKKPKINIINVIAVASIFLLFGITAFRVVELIINPIDIVMIERGSVTSEESAVGYIIRDEVILNMENDENRIIPIRREGDRVARGEVVFRYTNNDEEALRNRIRELDVEIQRAMDGQLNIFSADISTLERQIENQIDNLRSRNNIQEIFDYKNEINRYIVRIAEIAGELSPAGSYIRDLREQRTNYENQIYSGSEYVTAVRSGLISYRVDDLEEVLTVDRIRDLTGRELAELDLRVGQRIPTNEKVGKIVDNFVSYIATNVRSEDARRARVGQVVRLRVPIGEVIRATIHTIREDDDGSMFVVFEIVDRVEELIEYRKINLDIIWWEFEGLKVPNSAIIFDNGLAHVVRNRAGVVDKILVKVLRENENYSIVENYTAEELREMDFSASEINSMRRIMMFDELIVRPDVTF